MIKTLKAIRGDSRVYREWFGFVGRTLEGRADPQSVDDLAATFCAGGETLDGRPATPADKDQIARALAQMFPVFEGCRFISGKDEVRYTKNLGLALDERVASLTHKGRKVLKLPNWRVELLFQRYLFSHFVQQAWKPFAAAVGIAGTIVGVLKLVLLWRSEQAAIAGGLAGVAVLIGHFWRGRD